MRNELLEWVGRIVGQNDRTWPDESTLRSLIEVFDEPAAYLGQYPDEILDRALWDISDCAFPALYDAEIDWALRIRVIRSFEIVFRDLFAVRCAPVLAHRDKEYRPLNTACYMWWDFNCWLAVNRLPRANSIEPAFDSAMLESMRSVLEIDNIACQESALHGLGHWHAIHPSTVESMIDEFLSPRHSLPEPLLAYALNARRGNVL